MEKVYLEDYAVGEQLISPARTITESDFVIWSAWSGDWFSLHTDVEYAKKTVFGERIAHGNITFIIGTVLPLRLGPNFYIPKGFIGFYGVDRIRFTGAVKIGDTVRSEVSVAGLEPVDDKMGILVYDTKVINQRDETVMASTTRFAVARKPKK